MMENEYIEKKICRFCDNPLIDVIHLGNSMPLAGGFFRSIQDTNNEKTFPLTVSFCDNCKCLQCKQVVNSQILFKRGYFYYSSMIPSLVNHFNKYADHLSKIYEPTKNKMLIVEMGCNDGVFLRPLKEKGFNVIGIDPSNTVKKLIDEKYIIYNDFFSDSVANDIVNKYGKCDIFLSSNSFAHIDDMKNVFKDIKKILKKNGLLIIEVHYSKVIFDQLQFDFIYHEHMSYYTITSMYNICKLFGFSISNVEFTEIHGQSMRIYIENTADQNMSNKVREMMILENSLSDHKYYVEYMNKIEIWRNKFCHFFGELKKQNKTIYGYGSSGRANIIISYCGLDLDEIIDDAESKIGSYTPIYHKKIISSSALATKQPDYVLILAWPYYEHIVEKNKEYQNRGGKFIVPLPEIKIIEN